MSTCSTMAPLITNDQESVTKFNRPTLINANPTHNNEKVLAVYSSPIRDIGLIDRKQYLMSVISPIVIHDFTSTTPPKQKKRRHRWTKKEDYIIIKCVGKYGKNWDKIAQELGCSVSGRQIKDHWYHVIVHDKKSLHEEDKDSPIKSA